MKKWRRERRRLREGSEKRKWNRKRNQKFCEELIACFPS
jgi:hypothetical protein